MVKNPFAKLTQKVVETTSEQVRKEVKKTVLDVLPGLITIAGTIIGIVIFHNIGDSDDDAYDSGRSIPTHSSTTITTNNYFFQDISDDMMWKILEDEYGRD